MTSTFSLLQQQRDDQKQYDSIRTNEYHFIYDNGHEVHIDQYPPLLFIYFYHTIDQFCLVISSGSSKTSLSSTSSSMSLWSYHDCTHKWRSFVFNTLDKFIPDHDDQNDRSLLSSSTTASSTTASSATAALPMPLTIKSNIKLWLSDQYIAPPIMDLYQPLLSYNEFRTNTIYNQYNNTHYQSIYEYSFHTPSTQLGNVISYPSILILILLIVMIRFFKYYIIVPFCSNYIGKILAKQTHGIEWTKNKDNEERIYKFGEYCYRLLYHTCISIFGIYYFSNKEYFIFSSFIPNNNNNNNSTSTSPVFFNALSFYQHFPNHSFEIEMIWYYLIQCAYNIDAFMSLLIISFTIKVQLPIVTVDNNNINNGDGNTNSKYRSMKTKKRIRRYQLPILIQWKDTIRGDFIEMLIHHITTNGLVIASSYFRLHRCGAMVFLLHDISDIPVDLSKLANFVKWKNITILCFISMTIIWFITRLYYFPIYIWYNSYIHSPYLLQEYFSPIVWLYYRHFFLTLLFVLILLHMTWFLMFMKMFTTIALKYECHDYSEHKHGEKDHTTTNTNKSTTITNHQSSNSSITNHSSNGESNAVSSNDNNHDTANKKQQ